MNVLFVCLGNICRSPIAEGVLRHLAKEAGSSWRIQSAGLESYHIGNPPHRFSIEVCAENKIDISMQRARKFSTDDIERFDKVYALSADVFVEIGILAGKKMDTRKVILFLDELNETSGRSVKDPWYGDKDGYYEVFDEIEKCCRAIFHKYAGKDKSIH